MSFSLSLDEDPPNSVGGIAVAPEESDPPADPDGPRSSVFSFSGSNSGPSLRSALHLGGCGWSGVRRAGGRCLSRGLRTRGGRRRLRLRLHDIDAPLEIGA